MRECLYPLLKIKISVFVTVVLTTISYAQTKLISTGDEWLYYDHAEAPAENWYLPNQTNVKWKTGKSPLGYGDSDIATVVNYGEDDMNKHITKYFKKSFRINDPYSYLIYEVKLRRDDGIILYINGKEFIRDNMPNGPIDNNTVAKSIFSSPAEDEVYTLLLFPDDLLSGINTISASVHQASGISSDCFFNLELIADNDVEQIPLLLKENTIKNLHLDKKMKELNHLREMESKSLQYQLLEQSKDSSKNLFFIIFILLLLLAAVLAYFAKTYQNKIKKSDQQLKEFKQALSSKDQEMLSSSITSLNNQQFLGELKKSLSDCNKEDTAQLKKDIQRIIKKIDYNINQEEDWDNLKKHFAAIEAGYFERLIKEHPSLSEAELRHCIFIKLHMQTKEIAKILNIDPKSVQTSRYRIKKKMELGEGVNLKEYLLSI